MPGLGLLSSTVFPAPKEGQGFLQVDPSQGGALAKTCLQGAVPELSSGKSHLPVATRARGWIRATCQPQALPTAPPLLWGQLRGR